MTHSPSSWSDSALATRSGGDVKRHHLTPGGPKWALGPGRAGHHLRQAKSVSLLRRRPLLAGAALLVLALVAAVVAVLALRGAAAAVQEQARTLDITDGPRHDQHVRIPTRLFVPASATTTRPAPAAILAHGFGGSLDESRGEALDLARHGYVVLTYSARGFGGATGKISLDSPDYDVVDVRALVDLLA